MNNFSHATGATKTALESQGSAMRENSAYMESIQAKLSQLSSTFQNFANNVIGSDMIKGLLDFANGLLQLANTDLGRIVTQIILLTSIGWGATSLVKALGVFSTAIQQFKILGEVAGAAGAAGGIKSVSDAFAALSLAGGATLPIILAIATALAVGGALWKATEDSRKSFEQLNSEIATASEQLKTNQERIQEINDLPWTEKTPEILDEYEALQQQNDELQRNIDLLEEQRTKRATKTARSGGQVQQGTMYGFEGLAWSVDTEQKAWETLASTLDMAGASLDDVKKRASELGYTMQETAVMVKVNADAYDQNLTQSLEEYAAQLSENHEITTEQIRDYDALKAEVSERVEGLKQLKSDGEELTSTEESLIAAYDSLISAEADATDFTEKFGNAQKLTVGQMASLIKVFPEAKENVTRVGDAYYYTGNGAMEAASKILDANGNIVADEKATVDAVIAQVQRQLDAYAALVSAKRAVYAGYVKTGQKGTAEAQAAQSEWLAASSAWNEIQKVRKNIGSALATGRVTYGGNKISITPGGTGTGTKTGTKSPSDLALEEFKSLQKDSEHQTEMGVNTQEKYYDKLESLIAQYKDKATAHMKEYGLTTDEINRNMYQYEEEIYKGRAKLAEDLKDQQEKATKESIESQKQMWQDYLDTLQSEKSKMDSVISYATEYASRQISDIEDELSAVQDEIDAVNARYDEKIDKLNETNDALEEEIKREKLLQDLATAKSKVAMVFKNGRFQYVQDADAISAAQAALDEFDRNKVLEEQKKFIESQRALDLQDLLNKQEALNQEKKQWEEYKDGWSSLASEYEFQQNKLIAEQEYGIDIENSNWATRLDNLESFKQDYISKLDEIKSAQEALNNLTEQLNKPQAATKPANGGGTMSASAINDILFGGGSVGDDGLHLDSDKFYGVDRDDIENTPSGKGTGEGPSARDIWDNTPGWDLVGFANGTTSAPGGLAMVGENGPELRVLGQGDGVIPADITRNLWDWGKIHPSNLAARAVNYMFNIDNLSLPNARDATSLIDGLKQMAYQRAYKRA